tara:strand:+ start:786 stop:1943 length:1158 start_codon:yes stop_codon:yes gene_type:complete
MTSFPSYSGLQQRDGPTTRQSLGLEYMTTLGEYTHDTDPDDMASLYNDNLNNGLSNSLPLNYKTIVMTLLLNYYNKFSEILKQWNTINKQLNEIISQILENIPEYRGIISNMILKEIIQNALKLYTIFFSLPNAKQLGVVQDINLYSEIRSYKMIITYNLDNLSLNDKWNLPTFISTSLSRDTALSFQNAADRAMIHFVVPESKLHEFKYASLFEKDIHYPQNLEDSISENEVLLPPYSEFIFRGLKEETLPFYTWTYNPQGALEAVAQDPVQTKIYHLEFFSFGKKMPDELEKECGKNLNIKFKQAQGKTQRRKRKKEPKEKKIKTNKQKLNFKKLKKHITQRLKPRFKTTSKPRKNKPKINKPQKKLIKKIIILLFIKPKAII